MSKKKHEWTRKGVTASMAVVLAFGMVPAVPAFAWAEGETSVLSGVVQLPENVEFTIVDEESDLRTAIQGEGDVVAIELGADISLDSSIDIADGKTVVVYGGAEKHALSMDASGGKAFFTGDNGLSDVGLTIANVSFKNTGEKKEGYAVLSRCHAADTDIVLSGCSFEGLFTAAYLNNVDYTAEQSEPSNSLTISDCAYTNTSYGYSFDTVSVGASQDAWKISFIEGNDLGEAVESESWTYIVRSGASLGTRYDDLSTAVGHAQDGDTIVLGSGTFDLNGSVKIEKAVSLKGKGADKTFVEGAISYAVPYDEESTQTPSGLTIDGICFTATQSEKTQGIQFCGVVNGGSTSVGANAVISNCSFYGWKYGVTANTYADDYSIDLQNNDFSSTWCATSFLHDENAAQGDLEFGDNVVAFKETNTLSEGGYAAEVFNNSYSFMGYYATQEQLNTDADDGVFDAPYANLADASNMEYLIERAQEGAVLLVAPGEYCFSDSLEIKTKGVVIKAADSKDKPVLKFSTNAGSGVGFVDIKADGIVLKDLVIDVTNAAGANMGIRSENGTVGYETTVEGCEIKDTNTENNTHAFSLKDGSFTRIFDTKVEGCYAGITVNDQEKTTDASSTASYSYNGAKVIMDESVVLNCAKDFQLFYDSYYFADWNEMMTGGQSERASKVFYKVSDGEVAVRGAGNEGDTSYVDYQSEYKKAGVDWELSEGKLVYTVDEAQSKAYAQSHGGDGQPENHLDNGGKMYVGVVFERPVDSAKAVRMFVDGSPVNFGTEDEPLCMLDLSGADGDSLLDNELISYFGFADGNGGYLGDKAYNLSFEWYAEADEGSHELVAATSAVVERRAYEAPSGGGTGGGSTAPSEPEGEVTENEDGSTTTTVTEDDGSSVETTVSEDEGVTTVVEKDGDGAVTSVSATVTEEAVEAAAGKAIALPFAEPIEAASSEKAVEIEVQAPAGAKVAVPVAKAEGTDSVAPGAVLVLVDAEGNETVLPKTANDGSSLSAEIPGDCTLKVVDASASFPDVASDDWYEEQGVADFVSARGIMTGVEVAPGSFEFQGDVATNRGMFVTMLNRLEMEAKASSGEGFADVDPESWYAGSSAWAVEAGIATGYLDAEGNATFDGEGFVTREQMAAFLFRYAQWLGLDTSARAEQEIEGVSDYAKDAVSWAVAEGLIKGDDTTGAIRPGDGATRAEAAAVVMRMIELMA